MRSNDESVRDENLHLCRAMIKVIAAQHFFVNYNLIDQEV